MELDIIKDDASTEVGSYFVANYPPFSAWTSSHLPAAQAVLNSPVADPPPLGLYLHIPFCRKRCKFCYFRVYTDKNSKDVDTYMQALAHEAALYADRAGLKGREFEFVYFGGGTPSFLSSDQIKRLIDRISASWAWEDAREVTFECEPGTLRKGKLETIKAIGTTRLSLGVEHFDDEILSLNGRAHESKEVFKAYDWAREAGFHEINIDLIAGLLGETEDKWKKAVDAALALDPDSLTIYQMELPHNTVLSRETKDSGQVPPVADWPTKRRWVDYAFRLFEQAGYVVSSAYTVVKPSDRGRFIYRDSLWYGADMIGTGVASFSHFGGVHFQNVDGWGDYVSALLERDELPLARALPMTDRQRLTREMILQLKLSRIDAGHFRKKYGVEIASTFAAEYKSLVDEGMLVMSDDRIELTRQGLLCADTLLPRFFESQFQNIRYT